MVETTTMYGSSGWPASLTSALHEMTKKDDPVLDPVYWLNPLISPSTAKWRVKWRKWRFWRAGTTKMRSNDGLFGRAAYGSIELDAMVEKNKPLLDTIPCSSRSLSDFTTSAKIAPFPRFFSVPRPTQGGRRDLWWSQPLDQMYLVGRVRRRTLHCNDSLSQSSDIPAPRLFLDKRVFWRFPLSQITRIHASL